MTPDEIRNQLVTNGIAAITELRGCTASEIEHLERVVGTLLPLAYKQFLLAIGHGAGSFLRGTDVSYSQVAWLAAAARDLLIENGSQDELPKNAFVFYMHQGYEFGYFLIGTGEDPAVYQYVEGSGSPKVAWSSFTEYVVDLIRIHAEVLWRVSHHNWTSPFRRL